jgi:carbon monoxide dehydrogenase subunit G
MPEVSVKFSVNAPIAKVWELISDVQRLGKCISGVREASLLNSGDAEWSLSFKLGFVAKTTKLVTRNIELVPPTFAKFAGEGEDIKMEGTLRLVSITENTTEVSYQMLATGKGSLAGIINTVISRKMEPQTEEFVRNVKGVLESPFGR